ncbi:hypothetical protein AZZ68_003033, partial [Klebsiella pneumoniae]
DIYNVWLSFFTFIHCALGNNNPLFLPPLLQEKK